MKKPVAEVLALHMRGGRSPLYQWLVENHDVIAAELACQHRPGWEALARAARDSGVTDQNGHPPTRHAVRKAWTTLERRRPANQSPSTPRTADPVPAVVAVPVTPASPVQPTPIQPSTPQAAARPRNAFAPARFKPSPDKE